MVYIDIKRRLYALDRATGTREWSVEKRSLKSLKDGTAYITNDGNLYALNTSTGSKEWSFEPNHRISSTTVEDEAVYVSLTNSDILMEESDFFITLYALDPATGVKK